MKKLIIFLALLTILASAFAEDDAVADEALHFIPLAGYDIAVLGGQILHSPCAGLALKKDAANGDAFMAVGMYQLDFFSAPLLNGYPAYYHGVDLMVDSAFGRHEIIGALKSDSAAPFIGGLHTFQVGAAYGYRIFKNENVSLVLGAGLFVSDFDFSLFGISPLYVIPLPILRLKYESTWFAGAFDFIASPNLSFSTAPKKQFRFVGDLRMDKFRSVRDLIFDCSLAYRFFGQDSELGDFAGISFGVKNDFKEFSLREKGDSLEFQDYAIYGCVDITVLKLSGGYVLDSRCLYGEADAVGVGDGFFLSLQGLYQF